MAIARVDFNEGASSSAPSATAAIGTWAVGDTALVNVRWYGTPTLSSVTLTGESNLTLLGSPQTGGPDNARSQWALLSNVTSTGAKTAEATLSAAPDQMCVAMWRLSGCDTTNAEDARNGASGNSSTASVSVTTATAGAAIFAIMSNGAGDGTPGSGYTAETIADIFWYDSGEYDIDAGASGAKTVDFSLGGSAIWVINAIAIKPASTGAYSMAAESGSYSLTGQAAGLVWQRTAMTADQGSYSYSGQAATLSYNAARVFVAETGSYSLNGSIALIDVSMNAAAGSYALTGQAATTTYAGLNAYSLTAAQGSYSHTGQAANMLYARILAAVRGLYSYGGYPAGLVWSGAPPVTGKASMWIRRRR